MTKFYINVTVLLHFLLNFNLPKNNCPSISCFGGMITEKYYSAFVCVNFDKNDPFVIVTYLKSHMTLNLTGLILFPI